MGQVYSNFDFVKESNRIERIYRDPTRMELQAHDDFLQLTEVTVQDLQKFVSVVAPGHRLRNIEQMPGVQVGNHVAPPSGPKIEQDLRDILDWVKGPKLTLRDVYEIHHEYETLHPFSDGNGRSGRVLWLWTMGGYAPLGFLHHFYYQALEFRR